MLYSVLVLKLSS